MGNHILIVEDDSDIREGVRILLEGEGFLVTEASDGMDGLKKLSPETDLVILDIMMPGISGLKICREIRKTSYVPILFLTAKAGEADKLAGLMAGADDYLCKPFSYAELSARVRAILRRRQVYDRETAQAAPQDGWIETCGLRVSVSHNAAFLNNAELRLTETEYRLLLLMMRHQSETFSIQSLYENVWKEPFLDSSANTVMVHIRNLRAKIEENPQKPKIIQTIWGKGYRLG